MVLAPVYADVELIRNHWPSTNSALGFGVAGGLYAASQVEFRDGRFEKSESFSGNPVEGTLAYYLRGPKIGGPLPLEGQIRLRPMYVHYGRDGDTSRDFQLPKDSAIYEARTGVRVAGVPSEVFPEAAMEASLWHSVGYRDIAGTYGLAERPQKTEHLTQKTWTRLGMIFPFRETRVSAFLNGGIAEDTDPLPTFRLGGGLGLRTEFPLLLHHGRGRIRLRCRCAAERRLRRPRGRHATGVQAVNGSKRDRLCIAATRPILSAFRKSAANIPRNGKTVAAISPANRPTAPGIRIAMETKRGEDYNALETSKEILCHLCY